MDRVEQLGDVAEIMLDYVENKKTFQTDKPMPVPTRSYTDTDQWRAEMEGARVRTANEATTTAAATARPTAARRPTGVPSSVASVMRSSLGTCRRPTRPPATRHDFVRTQPIVAGRRSH